MKTGATLANKAGITLVSSLALTGLLILADLIGSHLIGYGHQTVEIISIVHTGHRNAPYRLNYRMANGKVDHMAWPAFKEGADKCRPGMMIDAIVSLSVGTAHVESCRYPVDRGQLR